MKKLKLKKLKINNIKDIKSTSSLISFYHINIYKYLYRVSIYIFYNMPITLNDTNISVQYGNADNDASFIEDRITTISNLTAEPYLESGERLYPPSRLFTTNNLTLTNEYYVSIAAGYSHTMFLTNNGKVYSCGYNGSGQLGITNNSGTETATSNPTLIITTTVGGTPTAFNT